MQLPLPGDLLLWVGEYPGPAMALLAALGIILSWITGILRKRRHSQELFAALEGSMRGRLVPLRGPGTGGFIASATSPPEPFREFSVRYRALSIFDPVDALRRIAGSPGSRLQVWAILPETPSAEILWARGQVPDRALGPGPERGLWMRHRLPLGGGEYVTRGTNPGALCRAFTDLHTRFGLVLLRMLIQREGAPQVEMVVSGRGLAPGDVPALLTGLRAAGRAALLE